MAKSKNKTKTGSDFMKVSPKIAIAAASLLALAAGGTAYVQQQGAAQTAPIQEQASTAAPVIPAAQHELHSTGPILKEAEGGITPAPKSARTPITEVKFQEVTDASALINALPYLRATVQDIWRNDAGNIGGQKTALSISENAMNADVVILRADGDLYCGSMGCSAFTFVRTTQGYIESNAFSINGPISLSSKDGVPSLHFCGDGVRPPPPAWTFQSNGQFAMMRGTITPKPPACK